MAHGHVSIVLGVQTGFTSIIHRIEAFRRQSTGNTGESVSYQDTYNTDELMTVLKHFKCVVEALVQNNIGMTITALGASPRSEVPAFFDLMEMAQLSPFLVNLEGVQNTKADALIYLPLDVIAQKQAEQLARLSVFCSRSRHISLAPTPKWDSAQLIALRETWQWVDPRSEGDSEVLVKELFDQNNCKTAVAKDYFVKEESSFSEPSIITRNKRFQDVLKVVDAVSDADSTILITGESGTGKELIAKRIHARSERKDKPFIAVNCGAIPSDLLESELFGHVKGAFTGAVSDREGRFQAAQGGTLFLDEIGELEPSMQVKLLRVLQTKNYEAVGSDESRYADVRIIAATNKDLEKLVEEGKFREDLYYRVHVIPVHIPPLKERREDVCPLIEYFVKKFSAEKKRHITGITRAAIRALTGYEWPGNVRELENFAERIVILKSSGMIDVLDFPEKYRRQVLSEIEYADIVNPKPKASILPPQHGESRPISRPGKDIFMEEKNLFTRGPINQQTTQETGVTQNQYPGTQVGQSYGGVEAIDIDRALRVIAEKFVFPNEGLDFNHVVDQFENILILHALERTGWNRNRAAGLLRLNRTTLVEKLKKKQLVPPMRVADKFPPSGNA